MPPSNFQDLTTSPPFGKLTVLERAPNGPKYHVRWLCRCDCGQLAIVEANHLRSGHTTSCGCQSSRQKKTHGLSGTAEFWAFYHLKDRCTNPNSKAYPRYGGRGITVEWRTFEQFFADMGPRPSRHHSIERLNNDGPYSKENCVWALPEQQASNKRSNHYVMYEDTRYTVTQLARHFGLSYGGMRKRLRKQGLF